MSSGYAGSMSAQREEAFVYDISFILLRHCCHSSPEAELSV
jgi:hypothetical protein